MKIGKLPEKEVKRNYNKYDSRSQKKNRAQIEKIQKMFEKEDLKTKQR